MIKRKDVGELIVISGTTCAGKDTVVKKLLSRTNDMCLAVTYTSRAPREGEIDGVNYYFVSKEGFEEKIKNDDFFEYANVHGNYYGTPKKEIGDLIKSGKDVILVVDV